MDKKLTDLIVKALVKEYSEGIATPELSEKFGLTRATVCRGLRAGGIIPTRKDDLFKKREVSDEIKQEIVKKFTSGMGVQRLWKEFHLHTSTITKILVDAGVWEKHLYIKAAPKFNSEDICNDYKKGLSKQHIANTYRISVNSVTRVLKERGIESNTLVPPKLLDEMVAEFNKGYVAVSDLAKIYNLHPFLVRHHLTNAGLDVKLAEGENDMEVKVSPAKGVPAGQLRKICREASEEVIQTLKEIIRDSDTTAKDKIAAGNAILDRGYGKPRELEEDEGSDASPAHRLLRLIPKGSDVLGADKDKTGTDEK